MINIRRKNTKSRKTSKRNTINKNSYIKRKKSKKLKRNKSRKSYKIKKNKKIYKSSLLRIGGNRCRGKKSLSDLSTYNILVICADTISIISEKWKGIIKLIPDLKNSNFENKKKNLYFLGNQIDELKIENHNSDNNDKIIKFYIKHEIKIEKPLHEDLNNINFDIIIMENCPIPAMGQDIEMYKKIWKKLNKPHGIIIHNNYKKQKQKTGLDMWNSIIESLKDDFKEKDTNNEKFKYNVFKKL